MKPIPYTPYTWHIQNPTKSALEIPFPPDGHGMSGLLDKLKEGKEDKELSELSSRTATLKKKKGAEMKEEMERLETRRKQMLSDQQKQQDDIPREHGLTVKHILRQEDLDDLELLTDGWVREPSGKSEECGIMVQNMLYG